VQQDFSLTELAATVNQWCADNRVTPANGQAANALSERNLRFYRTIGLLDAPLAGGGRGYGEKHRRQLVAIRLLQARGLPLRRIRELLHGRSLEELAEVETRALEEQTALSPEPEPLAPIAIGSTWKAHQIGDDFLLLSLNQRHLPESVLKQIQQLLTTLPSP
jgi:DNA-binding transcriptional MerR regulator